MKISIYPNIKRDVNLNTTKKIIVFLLKHNCMVMLENKYKDDIYADDSIKSFYDDIIFCDDLFCKTDLIITVGGDGTILKAAVRSAKNNIPMIGINLGHIGYMTELEKHEIDLLGNVLNRDYTVDERMMIDVSVERNGEIINSYCVLNDAVISNGKIAKMLKLDILSGNNVINTMNADGVIVSTPTGSTAYSLSAGGPFIEPELGCISVVPICPHTIFTRPIMFSCGKTISVRLCGRENNAAAYLTLDGKNNTELLVGDVIICKKSKLTTKLIRIKNNSFFDILKQKMLERSM